VSGLSSAAVFGTVSITTGGTVVIVAGLGSAQAFQSPGVTTPGSGGFNPALFMHRVLRP
jgi:hypothetical protein